MDKPKIVWLKNDLSVYDTEFKFTSQSGGAVVADTESAKLEFYIGNNIIKDTATENAVYDACDCYIRILAEDGTMNSTIVREKWVYGKCLSRSTDGDAYTPLGGTTSAEEKLSVGNSTTAGKISGAANDGTLAASEANLSKISLYVKPPLNTDANGGPQSALLALAYSYGDQ